MFINVAKKSIYNPVKLRHGTFLRKLLTATHVFFYKKTIFLSESQFFNIMLELIHCLIRFNTNNKRNFFNNGDRKGF